MKISTVNLFQSYCGEDRFPELTGTNPQAVQLAYALEADRVLKNEGRHKFVIYSLNEGDESYICLFSSKELHTAEAGRMKQRLMVGDARSQVIFLGAGVISMSTEGLTYLEFDSPSFRQEKGFDRPADETLADALLMQAERVIKFHFSQALSDLEAYHCFLGIK